MDFSARAWRVIETLALSMALARAALGQGAPVASEKVRLLYDAPAGCAGREEFLQQVRARLGTAWEAPPSELARTIRVNVSLAGARYLARIELQDTRGRQVTRAVAGDHCEQVIEGIALVTVLAIQAQLEESSSDAEPVSPDSSPPAATPNPQPTPLVERAPAARPPRPSPAASHSELKVRLGGRALVQQGAGPGLGTGVGAFAALAWPQVGVGLAFDSVGTGNVEAQGVPARFNLRAARLDGCGRFPWLSTSLTIEPCIYFQAGSLEAQGDAAPPEVTRGSTGATAWLAPGVLLAVRDELGPLLLGLEGSAGLTLIHEQFYVAKPGGKQVVYQVEALTLSAALSVGVTF